MATKMTPAMAAMITQMWGFDPLEVLERVRFPGDEYQEMLLRSKTARMRALGGLPISIPSSAATTTTATMNPPPPSTSSSSPSSSGTTSASTTRPSTQQQPRSPNNDIDSTLNDEDPDLLRYQLARTAAAVMIQSAWRGTVVRRKYLQVMKPRLSIASAMGSSEDGFAGEEGEEVGESWKGWKWNGLPPVQDLSVQERLILHYKDYSSTFERAYTLAHTVNKKSKPHRHEQRRQQQQQQQPKQHRIWPPLPPDFSQFCAAYIQATWRGFVMRRMYGEIRKILRGEDEAPEESTGSLPASSTMATSTNLATSTTLAGSTPVLPRPATLPPSNTASATPAQSAPSSATSTASRMMAELLKKQEQNRRVSRILNNMLHRAMRLAFVEGHEGDPWKDAMENAARVIQGCWKRYYFARIFKYYRDLIRFRLSGNPQRLLRFINPREAQLLDRACGAHIKFRLGGLTFPPIILYKIYTHHPLVDVNSFAPRDYTSNKYKAMLPRQRFLKEDSSGGEGVKKKEKEKDGKDSEKVKEARRKAEEGWYRRIENNGWRPVSDKLWEDARKGSLQCSDLPALVALNTLPPSTAGNVDGESGRNRNDSKKIVGLSGVNSIAFHYSKLVRKEEIERRKKQKKLDWLKKMYKEGTKLLSNPDEKGLAISGPDGATLETVEEGKEPGGDEEGDLDFSAEAEMDPDFLLVWTKALDYEEYIENWVTLATSGKSDDPATYILNDEFFEVDESPLGDDDADAANATVDDNDGFECFERPKDARTRPWSGKSDASTASIPLGEMFLTQRAGKVELEGI
ncbi:hypothetical protein HK102_013470 [Quaeritorhiza haematococci]|nr:hypothetical protein HK102_013470 [Quaeritorhiza haematococci]